MLRTGVMKETNTAVASLIFVAALIGDCLSAIDKTDNAVSASMRGSGLLLTLTAAAPVIKNGEWGLDGRYQAFGWAVLIVLAGLLGLHEGDSMVRAFDAVYVLVVCVFSVLILSSGGIDVYGKGVDETRGIMSAFAGSLLVYTSSRILRSGLFHSFEVLNASIVIQEGNSTFKTHAYAHASLLSTISVSFGGCVGVGAGMILLTKRMDLNKGLHLAERVTMTVGLCSLVSMCLAVLAQLSYGEQVDDLNAIYFKGACMQDVPACTISGSSRRFSIVNTAAGSLFLSSIGMAVLAFPDANALRSRSEFDVFKWPFEVLQVVFVVLVLFVGCMLASLPFDSDTWHVDVVALSLFLSCFVSFYLDTGTGQLIWSIAMAVEQGILIHQYGVKNVLNYLTHVFLLLIVILQFVHIFLSAVAFWVFSDFLDKLIGTVTISGLSLSLFLYLASAALQICLNGSGMNDLLRGNGVHSALCYAYQHYTPVVIWGSLVACRHEVGALKKSVSARWVAAAWVGSVVVAIVIYIAVFLLMDLSSPTSSAIEWSSMSIALVGGVVVPWLASAAL